MPPPTPPPPRPHSSLRVPAIAPALALVLAWLALAWAMLLRGLGGFGLAGPDEPRYAAIGRAMAARGDLITPRLWGAPWFEKPALLYWLEAAADRLFHPGAAASRLPSALAAALLSAALFFFLRRLASPLAARLAAFLSLTSVAWFAFGRAATTDMTLTVPLSLALMAFYLWWRENRPAWLWAAAALLGLATLAKGPVAVVLLALVAAAFAALTRRWRRLRAAFTVSAVAIFAAVAVPWYALAAACNPGFLTTFFLEHNLERFATNRFQHPQPFWYYLPLAVAAVFPWCGWLLLPLSALIRRLRARRWTFPESSLQLYLALWAAAPVVFFSLSRSKLPGYILPAVPALIAWTAVAAAAVWRRMPRSPLVLTALAAAALPLAVRWTPELLAGPGSRPPWRQIAADPLAWRLSLATAAILLLLALRRCPLALMVSTVLVTAASVAALTSPPLSSQIDLLATGRPLAQALERLCGPGLPQTCQSLPLAAWRLNRGLLYGAQFTLDAPLAQVQSPFPAPSLVIMDRAALPEFERLAPRPPAVALDLHANWIILRVR